MSDAKRIAVATILLALAGAAAAEPPVRDPTVPPGVSTVKGDPAEAPALRLRSTQVSETSRSAVINDRVVTPGSRIAGATVVAIEPGRVRLERGTERIELRITKPDVKRRATGDDS